MKTNQGNIFGDLPCLEMQQHIYYFHLFFKRPDNLLFHSTDSDIGSVASSIILKPCFSRKEMLFSVL